MTRQPTNTGTKDNEELGVNPEAVFLEFDKMKTFAQDSVTSAHTSGVAQLIKHFLSFLDRKDTLINPFDLAVYYSLEYTKAASTSETGLLNQISFYNHIFKVEELKQTDSEIHNHFEVFLGRLELTLAAETILEKLSSVRSVQLEIEGFELLTNVITHSECFFLKVASHFFDKGDELFYLAKQVMGKDTLKSLSNAIFNGSSNVLRVKICLKFFEFIIEFFKRAKDADFDPFQLSKCDKLAFHLFRRMGEFSFALRTFFKNKSMNPFVGCSDLAGAEAAQTRDQVSPGDPEGVRLFAAVPAEPPVPLQLPVVLRPAALAIEQPRRRVEHCDLP